MGHSRKPPRRVIIESPYAAPNQDGQNDNVAYARAAMLDSLNRGEAPFASHLLYTQVLNDDVIEQRHQGIEAGLAWGNVAEATVVYTDRGISAGMQAGIDRAEFENHPVEFRHLEGEQYSGPVIIKPYGDVMLDHRSAMGTGVAQIPDHLEEEARRYGWERICTGDMPETIHVWRDQHTRSRMIEIHQDSAENGK